MIKKISLIVIFILSICFCFTIITGCSENEEPPHMCIFNQEVIDEDYKESGASCDKKAKYFYSCICGEKGTQTFEYGEVLGHKFISYKYDNNSECEKDGTETSICSNSGCTITNTRDVVGSAHGHKFENYSFMDNATCIQNGTEIAKCNYCDNEDERVVQHSRAEHVFYNGKCTICQRDNYSLGLKYDKQADGNYILSGIGSCSDIDIFIPAEYSGGKVVGVKNLAFYSNEQIETIYFSENIKSIGVASFAKCKNLYFVSLNQDLEKIGNGAFSTCENLKEIVIPNNVSTIDGSAFFGCTTLRKIEIGTNVKEIKEFAFSECLNLEEIIYKAKSCNEWSAVDNYIFNNCGKNKEITLTISNTVEHIPAYLFAGYNGVGYTAYNEIIIAPKIVEVIFEENCKLRTIGQNAFAFCDAINKVNFMDNINDWVQISFFNSSSNPLCYAKLFYVNNEQIKEVHITSSTKVSAYAFYGCKTITKVIITSPVVNVGESSFKYCSSLKEVIIYSNSIGISSEAFYCGSLKNIVLPVDVKIGQSAFASVINVYYKGAKTQWDEVDINDSNIYLRNSKIYFYVENKSEVINKDGNYWTYDENNKIYTKDQLQ